MALKITTRQLGDVTILDAAGPITMGEGTNLLRDKFREMVAVGHRKLLLNLAGVSYMDSSGIGELVAGFTSLSHAEGRLKLVGLTRRVKELLQMTQVLSIFEAFEDEATAARSYADEIGK
jgi:anti-sigma B factor antagonist